VRNVLVAAAEGLGLGISGSLYRDKLVNRRLRPILEAARYVRARAGTQTVHGRRVSQECNERNSQSIADTLIIEEPEN
jgi:hypothetical protein